MRSPSSCLKTPSVCDRPPVCRCSTASVSGTPRSASPTSNAPITASATKITRQEPSASTPPPISGAKIGATLLNITSVANMRAAVAPSNRSRTTARAITIPAAPASPWRNRTTINAQIDGASAHSTDVALKATKPISSGRRRPRASLVGPMNNCPSAIPSTEAVSVSCPAGADACSVRVSDGSPGRYMSVASGPNIESAPSVQISWRGGAALNVAPSLNAERA